MRRLLGVSVILLLGLGALATRLEAQAGSGNRGRGLQLDQNYPNPFNPTTHFPFVLADELFQDGKPVRVTIRIYSVLWQLVAIPTAWQHPTTGNNTPVLNLEYPGPGRYQAYWDGTDRDGRKISSGVYVVQLEANGRRSSPIKITVAK